MFFYQIKHCQLKEMATQKLSFIHLLILEISCKGGDISGYKDRKLLENRGLISDNGFGPKVTIHGREIYGKIVNAQEVIQKVKLRSITPDTQYDVEFEKWWATYPSSSQFEYKGHLFKSERALRAAKTVCKQKYIKIIEQDKISPQVLQKCLEVEIATRKEESFNSWKKENKLHYMCGTEVYLNQSRYQGYLDREIPTGVSEKQSVHQSADIDI